MLADGLKETFGFFAKSIMKSVVQKFKDRKIVNEAQKCTESVLNSINLSDILDDIKEILDDKSTFGKLPAFYCI